MRRKQPLDRMTAADSLITLLGRARLRVSSLISRTSIFEALSPLRT